jgi:hypothetical protein
VLDLPGRAARAAKRTADQDSFPFSLKKSCSIMATRWFYRVQGKVVGPMTNEELLRKVRVEEIKPNTDVRKDDSAWFPAEQVSGLFEAAFKGTPKEVDRSADTEYHGD